MSLVIEHPDAEREFADILTYYETEAREGTADRFAISLRETVAAIAHDPMARPEVDPTHRRERVPRFPYDVIFRVLPDSRILIVAYHHHARRPGYWRRRNLES